MLNDEKTQTRRLAPWQGLNPPKVRYAVGDYLYVREPWRVQAVFDHYSPVSSQKGNPTLRPDQCAMHYEANGEPPHYIGKFRQAMHMPRWASRITLQVVDVRLQNLFEISEADSIAEGIIPLNNFSGYYGVSGACWEKAFISPRDAYFDLLDQLHGDGFSSKNPYMVAYSFRLMRGNVDKLGLAP